MFFARLLLWRCLFGRLVGPGRSATTHALGAILESWSATTYTLGAILGPPSDATHALGAILESRSTAAHVLRAILEARAATTQTLGAVLECRAAPAHACPASESVGTAHLPAAVSESPLPTTPLPETASACDGLAIVPGASAPAETAFVVAAPTPCSAHSALPTAFTRPATADLIATAAGSAGAGRTGKRGHAGEDRNRKHSSKDSLGLHVCSFP
jgi:hypothetical protein